MEENQIYIRHFLDSNEEGNNDDTFQGTETLEKLDAVFKQQVDSNHKNMEKKKIRHGCCQFQFRKGHLSKSEMRQPFKHIWRKQLIG